MLVKDTLGGAFELVQVDLPGKALEDPAPGRREGKALLRPELLHVVGYQDLSSIGCLADATGEVDGGAEQVVVAFDRLTRSDADPDAEQRRTSRLVAEREPSLDGEGTPQPVGDVLEVFETKEELGRWLSGRAVVVQ